MPVSPELLQGRKICRQGLQISSLGVFLALSSGVATLRAADRSGSLDLGKLPPPATKAVDYAKEVPPIFAKNCYSCHVPEKKKSGLRRDRKADAFLGGDSDVAGKVVDKLLA